MEIAKTTNTPVLFMAAEIPAEVEVLIKTADEPVVVQLKRTPIMAIKHMGEEVELAEAVTPPPAQELVTETTAPVQMAIGARAEVEIGCRRSRYLDCWLWAQPGALILTKAH